MKQRCTYRLLLTFLFGTLFVCIQGTHPGWSRAATASPQDLPAASTDLGRGISLYDKGNCGE
ncbi:MAG TPA: hypothetical protein VN920_00100, partial [Pyrinomonadaceae bacterium]|nr:hypothetical protein [Pyrinomonadaceae bacterium]